MASLASKRKRESHDMPDPRSAPGMGTDFEDQYLHAGEHGDNDMAFASALVQHNQDLGDGTQQHHHHHHHDQMVPPVHHQSHEGGPQSASDTAAAAMAQYHTMTVPPSTEQTFMQNGSNGDRPSVDPHDSNTQQRTSFGDFDISDLKGDPNGNSASPTMQTPQNPNGPKPQVGSDEWHKVRRDNHKEVERRRRETINEGITELSKIVPGCEKNKGSILGRSVQFITQLKDNETQNIEKWTLEKLLTEQAIAELSSSCDKLKAECQRAWAECEQWKKAAQKAGVSIDLDEKADADGEDA